MQMFIYVVAGLMIVASLLTVANQRTSDAPPAVVEAQAQVDRYRLFMYVAAQYMTTYSAGAATLTWSTLKTAPNIPSGAAGMQMPANWKVVVAADNSWVACTTLDERALGIVQQLATAHGAGLNPTQIASQQYVVVGTAADVSQAGQCQ
jgi:hypothetical protein